MKNKKTNLILILSVFTTILAVMIFLFFFRIIENKNKHISAVLTTLEEKMLEKENAQILKDKIIEIENTHKGVSDHILNQKFIDTFVSYLEDLGSEVGVDISVEGIEAIKNEKNLIKIKISSSGGFSNVMKSIALIENMPYKVEITQIYLNEDLIQPDQKMTDSEEPISKALRGWVANITFNIKSSK